MNPILLLLTLASSAPADEPFYPKATGQGEAASVNKDAARFSFACVKSAPAEYQDPLKGGAKAIITTKSGVVRTISLPKVEDAMFQYTRCTAWGPGTLSIDYGKGNVKKYEGIVRATGFDRTADSHNATPDSFSISFQSKDLKVPQISFQGNVTKGDILITHAPLTKPRPQMNWSNPTKPPKRTGG